MGVHGARAVHVQTICTLHGWPSSLRAATFTERAIGLKLTLSHIHTIHQTIALPAPVPARVGSNTCERWMTYVFGVGSSHLKECRVTRIRLGAPIYIYVVGTHDHVDMYILGCTLHVLGPVGSLIRGHLIPRIVLQAK